LFETLYILPVLLFSVIIHEIAHGWTALRCGDPTAKYLGRLTLNPIPHIDLVGSIIVPLFSLLAAGQVFIAWAKPVPVNPMNFKHYRRDDVLVSVAGPISNLLMALGCGIGVILVMNAYSYLTSADSTVSRDVTEFLLNMLHRGIYLNIILAVFNLIPVPPLDGSHVLASVLPPQFGESYRRIGFFGIFIILMLMNNPAVSRIFFTFVGIVASPLETMIRVFG
jgi:Zn-dependent protease